MSLLATQRRLRVTPVVLRERSPEADLPVVIRGVSVPVGDMEARGKRLPCEHDQRHQLEGADRPPYDDSQEQHGQNHQRGIGPSEQHREGVPQQQRRNREAEEEREADENQSAGDDAVPRFGEEPKGAGMPRGVDLQVGLVVAAGDVAVPLQHRPQDRLGARGSAHAQQPEVDARRPDLVALTQEELRGIRLALQKLLNRGLEIPGRKVLTVSHQ
mmetsp:Transcript_53578/g.155753  ORF Transcript_53578/g.155753 Transcript_53578/m.155753 type:complete len:215 (+) Transcript_53578:307-951(+)